MCIGVDFSLVGQLGVTKWVTAGRAPANVCNCANTATVCRRGKASRRARSVHSEPVGLKAGNFECQTGIPLQKYVLPSYTIIASKTEERKAGR